MIHIGNRPTIKKETLGSILESYQKNNNVIINYKGIPPKHIQSVLNHIHDINPLGEIIFFYTDTFFKFDLHSNYARIDVYEDFIEFFTCENRNTHERELMNVLQGDCSRIIFIKDIKSIQY